MIFHILTCLLATLLATFVVIVANSIVRTRLSIRKFAAKSMGIPMAKDFRLIGGHIVSLFFRRDMNGQLWREFNDRMVRGEETLYAMYGDKPMVFTIDLDLVQTIALKEQQVNINRSDTMRVPMREIEQDDIVLARGEQWRRLRRAIGPALRKNMFITPNVLEEIDGSIEKLISSLERKLNRSKDGRIEVDVDDYFHRYSLDLDLSCFYKQKNVIDFDSSQDQWVKTLDLGLKDVFNNPLFPLAIIFPIAGQLADWVLLKYSQLGKMRANIMKFIKTQTELNLNARKELLSMREQDKLDINEDNFTLKDGTKFARNMIDHVIDHYHEGKISKQEYYHSVFFLLISADKTSADALSQIIYKLALHRDKQDKLRESLRLNGKDSEYLTWVIDEALRLRPPVTIGCCRQVERDVNISQGRLLPKGTSAIPPVYVIHRLKKYWGEDAHLFRPERFAQRKSFHPCQFMPFGVGLRQCPGKEFALFEMRKLLTKLILNYEFRCEPKRSEAFDSPFLIFNVPHETALVEITRLER